VTDPKAGEAYSAFIKTQLKAEYDRRASLDGRGIALVTTSGTFVTLIFALATFGLGKDYQPSSVARLLVLGAVVGLCLAALLGLVANALRRYEVMKGGALLAMTREHWRDGDELARRVCADSDARTTVTLRSGNERKADLITAGLVAQLAGISAVVAAVAVELVRHR
jgi:hypothetical protein